MKELIIDLVNAAFVALVFLALMAASLLPLNAVIAFNVVAVITSITLTAWSVFLVLEYKN